MDKEEIVGDNIKNESGFVIYNVENDFPFIYRASDEHVKMCLPCAQKAMRHHAGVGNPLDEEGLKIGVAYVSQISERTNIILEQVQKILIQHEQQIRELNNTVEEISTLVKENTQSNGEILSELKETVKNDLTKFYKVITALSIPLIIGASFITSIFTS